MNNACEARIRTTRVSTPQPQPQRPLAPCLGCERQTRRQDGYCSRECHRQAILAANPRAYAAPRRHTDAELAELAAALYG